jgi:hypothetical protein
MQLMEGFQRAPTFAGAAATTEASVVEGGRRVVELLGESVEVVLATSSDLALAGFAALPEGFYVVGSGDTGAAETLFALAATNAAVALVASVGYRLPHPEWRPPATAAAATASASSEETAAPTKTEDTTWSVDANAAFRTPQVSVLYVPLNLTRILLTI